MLTGDKLETATCIAKSSRLVARTQAVHIFRPVSDRSEAHLELNAFRRKGDAALVITGESLEVRHLTFVTDVSCCVGGVLGDLGRWVVRVRCWSHASTARVVTRSGCTRPSRDGHV